MKVLDKETSTIVLLGLLFKIKKVNQHYGLRFIDDLNQEQTEIDIMMLEQERLLNLRHEKSKSS